MDERVKRNLPVKLTERELTAKGSELAYHIEEYDRVEAEKKRVTGELTEQLKELRKKASQLADVVEHGREFKPVDCRWVADELGKQIKHLVRLDTGEVIESVDLTPNDRQQQLLS